TPARGQVMTTTAGAPAPLARCSKPRCSVELPPDTKVTLSAVTGDGALFGGYHQYPLRTPHELVPWLGDPLAGCEVHDAVAAAARGDVRDCTITVHADTDVAAEFALQPERIDVAIADTKQPDKLIQPAVPAPPPPPIDAERLIEDKPIEVALNIKPPPKLLPPPPPP